ncbi:MAG: InlB B-repeat-containing protein [Oscillospiraceae bacterium]|nr:InlB B-repeat-containing protein [Oscillospiraceae bacterium]
MKRTLSILLAVLLLCGAGAVGAFAADYEISFDEGENPMGLATTNMPAPLPKDVGVAVFLPMTKPLREDYKFKGWAASLVPTATQKIYTAGEEYKSDETDRLYAIWEPDVCWVTINGNRPASAPEVTGLPTVNPVKKLKDGLLDMSTVGTPACAGYTFAGWARTAAGPATISATGRIADTADVTLYAIWEKNTFKVTFNANVPSGSVINASSMPTPKDKTRGVPLIIPEEPTLTKADYTFQGWATSATGTVVVPPGGGYTGNEAVTLYAIWKGRLLTVRYDKNDATATGGPMADTEDVEYGKAVTLRANAYSVNLKTFKGWATKADGPVVYTDGQSVALRPAEAGDVVTLYAVWKGQDTTALLAKIKEAEDLEKNSWKYTAETWAKLLIAVDKARTVAANPQADIPAGEPITAARIQLEIDNAANGITKAIRELETKELIFTTKHEQSIMNWLLFIFAFGWIWMWFI